MVCFGSDTVTLATPAVFGCGCFLALLALTFLAALTFAVFGDFTLVVLIPVTLVAALGTTFLDPSAR